MFLNTNAIIRAIHLNMPHPEFISNVDTTGQAVCFTWRGDRFRVNLDGKAWQYKGHVYEETQASILIEALIKKIK